MAGDAIPDHRDFLYAVPGDVLGALPTSVDMRPYCPAVYDQGQLGICVSNAVSGAIHFTRMRQKLQADYVPSRLFSYFNTRVIENSVNSDAGAEIRDCIKVVAQQGDCPETEWPYVISQFTVQPPAQCYVDALPKRATNYYRLTNTNLSQLKGCLATGFPFVFGFSVYASFESSTVSRTGSVPMPANTEQLLGGHAMLAIGYRDSTQTFICRNSWGGNWGMVGYCEMPYAYLTSAQLSDDFWTISLVTVT